MPIPTPNNMPKRLSVTETPLLLITRGISNSGKSTWAKKWIAEDPANRRRVNRDTIREAGFTIAEYTAEQEEIVTAFQQAAIRSLLRSGKSVIVDDTNLYDPFVRTLHDLAAECGAKFDHKDFNITLEQAIANSHKRTAAGGLKVEEEIITQMFERHTVDGKLRPFPKM